MHGMVWPEGLYLLFLLYMPKCVLLWTSMGRVERKMSLLALMSGFSVHQRLPLAH